MTQVTQVDNLARNTKDNRARSRLWAFTLNNYSISDIVSIETNNNLYDYIFQEEKGLEGTPHLQGMLCYKNAVTFNTVKKKIPKAHIEVGKNKMALIKYSSKNDTRVGKIYTNVESWKNDTNDTSDFKKKNIGLIIESEQKNFRAKEVIERQLDNIYFELIGFKDHDVVCSMLTKLRRRLHEHYEII